MPLKASDVFKSLNFLKDENCNSEEDKRSEEECNDNLNSERSNLFEAQFVDDSVTDTDEENLPQDLLKQCKKILVDFPDLDLNEFVDSQKSNEYLTESFTEIISHSQ